MEAKKRDIKRSLEYWERAEKVIPAGTQTLSKSPTQFIRGVYPIYLKSGRGSHVFDIDGNEYIDYPQALGPVTLGYAYPAVDRAIEKQLKDGIIFSLMHPLEVELSELLTEIIPCAEMVRFGKNGADATSSAVRAARAHTGREKIASCGYHGYQDWFIVTKDTNKGIPKALQEYTKTFEYNKIETLEKIFEENKDEIAAVILEPLSAEEPEDNFLEKVRDLTHENGALLIFDEIVSGFRVSLGGAQERFKVTPDLACFGKGMANGMPLSALVGKKEIMKIFNEVFFSTTFGGETLSLAASIATINEIREKDVIAHIHKFTKLLRDGYDKLAQENGIDSIMKGFPRTKLVFRDSKGEESAEMKSLFFQEAVKRGVLFGDAIFISYSHNEEDMEKTLEASNDALGVLKKAIEENDILKYMEGEVVQPVFRRD